jgi:hypothetical protein
MPLAYPNTPSLIPIERPRCPKCQARTMLARIEPRSDGADLRTFDCPKCEHTKGGWVDAPMKSDKAAGWENSELRPPEQGSLNWPLSFRAGAIC